jgi:hypothetical protein
LIESFDARKNATIDRTIREYVRGNLRVLVNRILATFAFLSLQPAPDVRLIRRVLLPEARFEIAFVLSSTLFHGLALQAPSPYFQN